MADFLGSDFTSGAADEIDFDAAASAFPDISLDGDIPSMPAAAASSNNDFFLDEFEAPRETVVKVTGDDEIEKFSSEFPDIDVGPVSVAKLWLRQRHLPLCVSLTTYLDAALPTRSATHLRRPTAAALGVLVDSHSHPAVGGGRASGHQVRSAPSSSCCLFLTSGSQGLAREAGRRNKSTRRGFQGAPPGNHHQS